MLIGTLYYSDQSTLDVPIWLVLYYFNYKFLFQSPKVIYPPLCPIHIEKMRFLILFSYFSTYNIVGGLFISDTQGTPKPIIPSTSYL